nr:putative ribonuclease H-like domain-containing protein [Tanacetum cinerariifolium]
MCDKVCPFRLKVIKKLEDVIENGNSFKPVAETTTNDAGTSTTIIPGPVTIEENAKKKNDVKAKSMLLMALPNEHLITFNQYKDAKTLFVTIETRFVGNEATKKTQKTLLNTSEVPIVFGVSTASPQVSTTNLSDATVYAFLANQPNGSQLVHEDLEQIHEDDLEEIDLKWQLALLSMRAKRFFQKTGKKIPINGSDIAGYDKSKVECFNCHKMTVNVEDTSSKAMVVIDGAGFDCCYMADDEAPTNMAFMAFLDSELEKINNEKNALDVKIGKFTNVSQSLDKLIGSQITDNGKSGLGYVSYNVVPPSHTERFSPPRIDLSHTGLPKFTEPSVKSYGVTPIEMVAQTSSVKISAPVKENISAPLIEDWESDEEDEVESPLEKERKNVEPSVNKVEVEIAKQNDKPARRPVKYAEMYKTQRPRGNQRNWNNLKSYQLGSNFVMYNKACYGYGSFTHLQARCKYHQRERMVNGTDHSRVNHNATTVPKAMLTRTGLKPVNSIRPVKLKRNFFKKINTAKEKVNTGRLNLAVLNVVKANKGKAVKASACWVWRPIKLDSASIVLKKHIYIDARGRSKSIEDQGYFDSGCSWHMTGNISYLTDFKEFDGGYVAFGGGAKGGEITGKVQSELMCDKKNNVLFTDIECFVMSCEFKLDDESHVLLKVPNKNNMYSVDMKNIVHKKYLTYLVAKASNDESMLWHRRLGHINFKNINKLFKHNLVRGLPSKRFENDQTCVACLKGKQHKVSFKSKIQNSISQPLFMLLMDLFGPTS